MSDDGEFNIPEEDIDHLFGQIVATSLDDISGDIGIVDVHLTDGSVFRFHGLNPVQLTTTLAAAGVAVLQDDSQKVAVLFAHSVVAIIGGVE